MGLNGLTWTLRRLAGMSGPEVLHRIAEQDRRRHDRRRHRPGTAPAAPLAPSLAGLRVDPKTFARLAPRCLRDWRDEVARARAGNWHFLGQDWPAVPLDRLWHLDPDTGTQWDAARFCFDVPYRNRADRGDVKYVWEINRLQILPVAAALWRAEGRDEDRRFCLQAIDSWITANPPYRGINWCSGIELALRAISLLATVGLLGAQSLPADLAARLGQSLAAHYHWLRRYPSRYSSANNHRIAELGALYVLARTLPGLDPDATQPAADLRELGAEACRQIHPDGVGAEQSPTYTAFSLEWLCLAHRVAAQNGQALPPSALHRMAAAASHLSAISDCHCAPPRIGDDDEGRVFLSGPASEADYVANVLSVLRDTLARPNAMPDGARPHLRQLWLGNVGGTVATPAPAPSPKRTTKTTPVTVRHFDAGGYTTLRRAASKTGPESLVVMDHGPLGYLSIAAHGHADALAIWWHLGGQPVLADAGTYLYHSGGQMRDRLRGTALHNSLCLDQKDQSRIAGPFNWSRKAQAGRIAADDEPNAVTAQHDGYLRSHGLWHQRRVAMDVSGGVSVTDQLCEKSKPSQTPPPQARITFVLHPRIGCQSSDNGQILIGPDGPLATVSAKGENGQTLPLTVHPCPYSPRFGRLVESRALWLSQPASALMGRGIETRFKLL